MDGWIYAFMVQAEVGQYSLLIEGQISQVQLNNNVNNQYNELQLDLFIFHKLLTRKFPTTNSELNTKQ